MIQITYVHCHSSCHNTHSSQFNIGSGLMMKWSSTNLPSTETSDRDDLAACFTRWNTSLKTQSMSFQLHGSSTSTSNPWGYLCRLTICTQWVWYSDKGSTRLAKCQTQI